MVVWDFDLVLLKTTFPQPNAAKRPKRPKRPVSIQAHINWKISQMRWLKWCWGHVWPLSWARFAPDQAWLVVLFLCCWSRFGFWVKLWHQPLMSKAFQGSKFAMVMARILKGTKESFLARCRMIELASHSLATTEDVVRSMFNAKQKWNNRFETDNGLHPSF